MRPADLPTTTELLDGLHEQGNQSAWNEFDRRYRPVLFAFLRRMGVNEIDADDVAQETLACFLRDYRANKYDRRQGRLRTWLIGIARCRLADLRRAAGRQRAWRGDSAIRGLPDDEDPEAVWEEEQRRVIFEQALAELRQTARFRERTLEAFDRVVLRHEPIDVVSAELDLTPQEIYNAKNRVVARLRDIAARYDETHPDD
jgi:RNA polymerase sigma-70 factor (ECF subfamily)